MVNNVNFPLDADFFADRLDEIFKIPGISEYIPIEEILDAAEEPAPDLDAGVISEIDADATIDIITGASP